MAKLSLKFENQVLKELPVGNRPLSIGRLPDNDMQVDNLAVSNYHARIYYEAGRLVVEDLNSLNGTFVNELRIERATLHDRDNIFIGKHTIVVDATGTVPLPMDTGRKTAAPVVDETMVLDTKERREMLHQAVAMGERSQFAPDRLRIPTLVILRGKTDQKEYVLNNKLTLIGKSSMATVRMRGWFIPKVVAQINKRDDGFYIGPGEKEAKINGAPIYRPSRLNDGDIIEVGGLRMNFVFRE